MSSTHPPLRIGVYGHEAQTTGKHGCGLWQAGIAASLAVAEAEPVTLPENNEKSWGELLDGIDGVVIVGHDKAERSNAFEAEALVSWCHDHNVPVLAIDHGLLALNTAHGGTIHNDLPRDMPEALQHRHPPERGLRHAINVLADTWLANLYGEGEVVVNSEHRRAINRLARGFRVSARALDGIIEAIETTGEWWAMGVQWNPTSSTSSGLDIQLFRALVQACRKRVESEVGEQDSLTAA
ncbi:MAG: gamma-glutamyl-gamma-aminobutyrate hydrolase family protein [Gemmataceae bacterium]